MPPKKSSKQTADGSPSKPGKSLNPFPSPRKKKINKDFSKKGQRVQVVAFPPPLCIEVCSFVKQNGDDGFLNTLVKYVKDGPGEDGNHAGLDSMNLHKTYCRRSPGSRDEIEQSTTGYAKRFLVNYAEDDVSTPESRMKGMTNIKAFLMDPKHQRYPATAITLEDLTDEENYASLDDMFLDDDIEYLLREVIHADDLNKEFFEKFPYFASHCWKGTNRSNFAHSLGFL